MAVPTTNDRLTFARDAAERVLVTFAEAFLAALVAAHAFDLPALKDAANIAGVAALAAASSLVKSFAARLVGSSDSASLAG